MLIYRCPACGQEAGFTELDKPHCRYCESKNALELISKRELTPEVMAERLKSVADNMMKNLEQAYETMDDSDKEAFGETKDAEEEMLKLLARVKKFRDQIHDLELKDKKSGGL